MSLISRPNRVATTYKLTPMVFCYLLLLMVTLKTPQATAADASTGSLRVCMISSELFPLWRKPGDEGKPYPGINIEMMRNITDQLGLRIKWERAPFARCLLYLQTNKVDAVNVASYKPEREKYGVYPKIGGKLDISRRFKFDTYYAFVKTAAEANYDGERFYNLAPLPIAVEIKASIIPQLQAMGLELLQQPEAKLSFKMLERNRVSAVVTNQYYGLKHADMDIRRLEPALSEKAYFLVFSKEYYAQHTDLVERIWFISGQMQAHLYQQTLQKYASLPGWP